MEALQKTVYGGDIGLSTFAYDSITLTETELAPRDVALPEPSDFEDLTIWGIDGSNQRIDRSSFYLILARAALVHFRYSRAGHKPYYGSQAKDLSGLVLVDGNVFNDDVFIHTRQIKTDGDNALVLPYAQSQERDPLLVRHDPEKTNRNPNAQALGWGVKFQQALELAQLAQVPKDTSGVCIRDGPLFSTSVSPGETAEALGTTYSWKNKVLVSCSKRVSESTLLVEALLHHQKLKDYWFAGQELTDSTLKSIATDMLLLPRLVKPGQRTPLMAAVPRARKAVVEIDEDLTPLACYYLSRTRPHTFVRLEVPRFMWKRDAAATEKAIQIVAWQHELGRRAPLVQLFADDRCQLTSEAAIIRHQTSAALATKSLDFPEVYE